MTVCGAVLIFVSAFGCNSIQTPACTADSMKYHIPEQKYGERFWILSQPATTGDDRIIDNLVAESLCGLYALAVNEGRSRIMLWMETEPLPVYETTLANLPMKNMGHTDVWRFLARTAAKNVVAGYVLYDISNQESINAATVASHVYGGVMVEKRDRKRIEELGYPLLCDVSAMSLADAWEQFGSRCSKTCLVLMPALTSNQRSTAISQRMMVVNLNKVSYKPDKGNNRELLLEILMGLEPLSPVFGWEQNVGEDSFVGLVSRTGNLMIPYDWTVNTPILWAEYRHRRSGRIRNTDVTKIKFGDAAHYMSFYMSDGDNVMWAMTGYDTEQYYGSPLTAKTKMSFGYPVINLSMMSPDRNADLLSRQPRGGSLLENFGGGYYYADDFAELKDRKTILPQLAKYTAANMQQRDCNVLALVAGDVLSMPAQDAYKAFIQANNRLIGIVVIQYTPYAGGKGAVMWFKNAEGYDIPVITVRYSLWNYGEGRNGEVEGTPAYIAAKYTALVSEAAEPTFSITSVHAWSDFYRSDDSSDQTAENRKGGTVRGVGSAELCMEKLPKNIKIVNIEELIWQLRRQQFPCQVEQLINRNRQKGNAE